MSSSIDTTREEPAHPLAFAVGFFFSFRAILVLFSVRVLGTEPRTGATLTLAAEFLLLGLAGFSAFGSGNGVLRGVKQLRALRWVVAFLAFSGCSLAWSGTVSLPTSAAYWCGLAADVLIVLLLISGGPVSAVTHAMLKGFVWSSCCLALVAWIMPAQADLRLGDEEFFNTNQIGNLCAFAIFLAQFLARRRIGRWGFAIAFLALTLLRSLSKTTLAAFLLGQGFLLLRDRSIPRKTKVLLTVGVLAAVLLFWGLFAAYYEVYTTAGNQAETLTGRVGIWAWVAEAIPDHLWFGHGFDAMWKVIPPFGPDRFEARHAENEVLQQLYAYGAVGLVLLAGIYGSLLKQIRRLPRDPVRALLLSMMVFFLVRGLAEAEPFDLLLPLWTITLFGTVLAGEAPAPEPATAPSVAASSPVPARSIPLLP